jgi:hypothetical protein
MEVPRERESGDARPEMGVTVQQKPPRHPSVLPTNNQHGHTSFLGA